MRRLNDVEQDIIVGENWDEDDRPYRPEGDMPEERLKIEAMRHAWSYFSHHDDHRITLFRFFLLTFAALTAIFLQLSTDDKHTDQDAIIRPLIAIVALIAASIFRRLDLRSQQLVDAAKEPLRALQKDLSLKLDMPAFNIIEESHEKSAGPLKTFNSLLPAFFSIAKFLSILALVYVARDIVDDIAQARQWTSCVFVQAVDVSSPWLSPKTGEILRKNAPKPQKPCAPKTQIEPPANPKHRQLSPRSFKPPPVRP